MEIQWNSSLGTENAHGDTFHHIDTLDKQEYPRWTENTGAVFIPQDYANAQEDVQEREWGHNSQTDSILCQIA